MDRGEAIRTVLAAANYVRGLALQPGGTATEHRLADGLMQVCRWLGETDAADPALVVVADGFRAELSRMIEAGY